MTAVLPRGHPPSFSISLCLVTLIASQGLALQLALLYLLLAPHESRARAPHLPSPCRTRARSRPTTCRSSWRRRPRRSRPSANGSPRICKTSRIVDANAIGTPSRRCSSPRRHVVEEARARVVERVARQHDAGRRGRARAAARSMSPADEQPRHVHARPEERRSRSRARRPARRSRSRTPSPSARSIGAMSVPQTIDALDRARRCIDPPSAVRSRASPCDA